MGKKSCEIAQYYVIFEKCLQRERNYPEVIYYNISKTASEQLWLEFDFHLWLVLFFHWSTYKGENGFKTCMVSSRGWHGSLSSTIYCSRFICSISYVNPASSLSPGHLELYQSGTPVPNTVNRALFPSLSLLQQSRLLPFHHRLFRQEFLVPLKNRVLTCHSLCSPPPLALLAPWRQPFLGGQP